METLHIQRNEEIGDEDRHYTKEEELLWSSLWEEGYDADKKNLIKTFRTLLTTKDQACRAVERELFLDLHKQIFLFGANRGIEGKSTSKEQMMFYDLLEHLEEYAEQKGIEMDAAPLPTKDSI